MNAIFFGKAIWFDFFVRMLRNFKIKRKKDRDKIERRKDCDKIEIK